MVFGESKLKTFNLKYKEGLNQKDIFQNLDNFLKDYGNKRMILNNFFIKSGIYDITDIAVIDFHFGQPGEIILKDEYSFDGFVNIVPYGILGINGFVEKTKKTLKEICFIKEENWEKKMTNKDLTKKDKK